MNSVSGDPVFSVPNAIGSGGSTVDLSNYPDLEDATLTQANTIPVFETSGQKRLKLTTYEAGDFDTRITTNTQDISAAQSNVDVLTTNFNTHAASQEFHANVGKSGQGINTVALGSSAAQSGQGRDSVAVGARAGENTQGVQAVAVGSVAGKDGQGQDAVAIGYSAASQGQGAYAVAIGSIAANTSQGDYAIAIGRAAVAANQAANSIAVNASNNAITANQAGFFVAPVRNGSADVANSDQICVYDATKKEIFYKSAASLVPSTFYSVLSATANHTLYTDSNITFRWQGTGYLYLNFSVSSNQSIWNSIVKYNSAGSSIERYTTNNGVSVAANTVVYPHTLGTVASGFWALNTAQDRAVYVFNNNIQWRYVVEIYYYVNFIAVTVRKEF